MFCLLVVLVKSSLLAKWLARKTPLRKPNRGEGIVSRKPRLKRAYDCVGLLYSLIVLLHDICVLSWPYVIHFLLLWHDITYLCWKCCKTPTNWPVVSVVFVLLWLYVSGIAHEVTDGFWSIYMDGELLRDLTVHVWEDVKCNLDCIQVSTWGTRPSC